MKYDFSKCNNLQFKAKDDEGEVMTGYLKVTKEGEECVVYLFSTDSGGNETYDRGLQFVIRDYARCEIIEDFSVWAEEHDLEIVPRDPETYTDWKVGDKVNSNTFRIVLTQGLNRQIRRMCQELGYKVEKLTRIRVMNIELGDLACGEYRVVEGAEKEKLYNSL